MLAVPTAPSERAYAPLADYGAIGNGRAVALVSLTGSIDWLCLPHFSGDAVFAALLDDANGGRFSVRPKNAITSEHRYVENTNVLETTFRCREGVLKLTDFMALGSEATLEPQHELARLAECVSGRVTLESVFEYRPEYGCVGSKLAQRGRLGWATQHRGRAIFLNSDIDFRPAARRSIAGVAELAKGQTAHFSLTACDNDVAVIPQISDEPMRTRLDKTVRWWRDWLAVCCYAGPYSAQVNRSCLALKLLTHSLSGAIVAAPTTSLPASPDGDRNWDYRYCWLRDASLALSCFVELGFENECAAFREWLLHATRLTQPRLQVMYDVWGETKLKETCIGQLEGYGGRGPVRVGNSAHAQFQMDSYGEVLSAIHDYVARGCVLDSFEKKRVKGFAAAVETMWRQPDRGIWEIRGESRHHTHSKLMCWAAIESVSKIHHRTGLGVDVKALAQISLEIRRDVEAHGFDRELGSFVGCYGSREPDASVLMAARYGFIDAADPRMASTYRFVERELVRDHLTFRFRPNGGYDGVGARDNFFAPACFWRVDYLARAGRIDEATRLFERLLAAATSLGLYAEGFDAETGAPAGNYPQAFSHVEMILAALALQHAQGGLAHDSNAAYALP